MTDIKIQPIDEQKLYIIETYGDGVAGQLQVKIPVNFDGHRVLSRPVEYIGYTQVHTTAGQINVHFQIAAESLREAFEKWGPLAQDACTKIVEDMRSRALRNAILAPGDRKA